MTPTGREPWRNEEERLETRRASASRDAGLRRVSRLTGWAVAIAIGLTGLFSEVVAHALPGRSKHAAARTPRARPASTIPAAPAPSADGSDQAPAPPDQQPSNPQPPQQVPAPSTASGGAVSGGS
jgi:hypothetical protein